MAKQSKIQELEESLQVERVKRLHYADQQIKWQIREAALLRVIFHLSDALDKAQGR